MTTLTKPVRRKTARAYSVLYQKARPIVASLIPGDVIEFRELGRRQRWLLAIDTAFQIAVRAKALADKRERKATQ